MLLFDFLYYILIMFFNISKIDVFKPLILVIIIKIVLYYFKDYITRTINSINN